MRQSPTAIILTSRKGTAWGIRSSEIPPSAGGECGNLLGNFIAAANRTVRSFFGRQYQLLKIGSAITAFIFVNWHYRLPVFYLVAILLFYNYLIVFPARPILGRACIRHSCRYTHFGQNHRLQNYPDGEKHNDQKCVEHWWFLYLHNIFKNNYRLQ